MRSFFTVIRKYAVFSGRARRTEYWAYTLIYIVIYLGLTFLDFRLFGGSEGTIEERAQAMEGSFGFTAGFFWLLFLPSLAVSVRRLHDANRTGLWTLILLVPMLFAVGLGVVMGIQGADPQSGEMGGLVGLFAVIGLVMLLTGLIFLVLMLLPGTVGHNRFGPDPRGRGGEEPDVWPDVS